MSREKDLDLARKWSVEGEVDKAYMMADRYLKDNPNDLSFLTIMVYVMLSSDKPTIAYHLAKRASDLSPNDPAVWVNMGMACQDLWRSKEAERAYKRGIRLAPQPEQKSMLMVNLCALYIDTGRFAEAEPYAKESLKLYPEHRKSLANLGFCQLAQRNWKAGWPNYRQCIGHDWRPRTQYDTEPEWDGKKVDDLVLYAEQGLGDVISFASMVPFAQTKCTKLVLDVDRRLEGLFKKKKKPVIGLAWRGGIPKTGAKYRQWDLEQLLPILQSVDAHWVSLQYKSAAKEIEAFRRDHPEIDLVEYPHATLTNDYDDTAALVSALDQIVCMQTAVTHRRLYLGQIRPTDKTAKKGRVDRRYQEDRRRTK
jgi:tetratricopeptide (TPR) repeat protein